MRPALRLLLALAVLLGWWVVAPDARACACGAVEPADGHRLSADGEQAAIVFDGTRQTTAISMGLEGDGEELAFLLPVPATAELSLAPDDLFTVLDKHTRPEVRTEYRYLPVLMGGPGDGAPGGAPGVDVTRRQQIGDYDVAELSGEPGAVGTWLEQNGFRVREEVLAGLGVYLEEGWRVLAVRLVLDAVPDGPSQPLVATFATDHAVYPMRLGATATRSQAVRLYVLAEHRVVAEVEGSDALRVRYAGPPPAAMDVLGSLPGEPVLTAFDDSLNPRSIDGDVLFTVDPAGDVPYRQVRVVVEDRSWVTLVGVAGVLLLAHLALLTLGLVSLRRTA
ncbi:DUF2330 domain-containing protein [Auraticoccus monumenti]|uniref:DUF2330 domain-containing protein n=1 Tax=Auraticoccus monumenti TaxID=675864 RepID=A0A1G6SQ54_9ACTN|nr:DUF2330 domain-containing protein [Auraticoccus monumenti]SDD18943.1 hypothetical protein SAMN04489747_0393 [Auraticoccus monumenti]